MRVYSNNELINSRLDSVESNDKSTASICSAKSYWLNTELNSLGIRSNRCILDLNGGDAFDITSGLTTAELPEGRYFQYAVPLGCTVMIP